MTVEAAVPEIEMMTTAGADLPTEEETTTIAVADLPVADATMMTAEAGTAILGATPKPLGAVGKIAMTVAEAVGVHLEVATTTTIEADEAPLEAVEMTIAGAAKAVGSAITKDIPKLPDAAGKIAMTAAEAEAVHPEVAMTTTIEEDEALLEAALDTTMTIAAVAVPHVAEMMTMDAVGMATPRVTPKPLARAGKAETAARAMTMIAADADADARLQ
jgi:hypothetical protein